MTVKNQGIYNILVDYDNNTEYEFNVTVFFFKMKIDLCTPTILKLILECSDNSIYTMAEDIINHHDFSR